MRDVLILILIQEETTGDITFYMKGADVAMASIVQYNDWLEEEVKAEAAFVQRVVYSTCSFTDPCLLRCINNKNAFFLWTENSAQQTHV